MSDKTQNRRCAIVFMRVPEIGKVKTRLSRSIDEKIVLALYKNFAMDVFEKVQKCANHIRICYHPPGQEAKMISWLGNTYEYVSQTGKDLGERMENAFRETFSDGYTHLILIGTDFPDLPEAFIGEAFGHLENDRVVIGPASDGGYYLVGFPKNRFLPRIFKDMPWGTDQVYSKTIRLLKRACRSVHLLPEWRDIDDYDDLLYFITRSKTQKSEATNTTACLKRYELI